MLVNNLCEGTKQEILGVIGKEILNEGIVHYTGSINCVEDDGSSHEEYYFNLYGHDSELYEVMYYKGKLVHKTKYEDLEVKERTVNVLAQTVNKFGIYYDECLSEDVDIEGALSFLDIYFIPCSDEDANTSLDEKIRLKN